MDLITHYRYIIQQMNDNDEYRLLHSQYISKMKCDLSRIIKFEKYIHRYDEMKHLMNELDKLHKK